MRLPYRASLAALSLGMLLLAPAAWAQTPPPVTTPPTTPPVTETPAVPALTAEQKAEILKSLEEVVTKQAFVPGVDLDKWPEYLEKQREAIDKAEKDSDFTRAVNGALRNFGISHIRFLAPRAATMRRQTSVFGVGLLARREGETLVVTHVFPKSPAEEAGIKNGDAIVSIDGKTPESPAVLQGEAGTEALVKVKSAEGMEREVKLKRAAQAMRMPDSVRWIGDDAAVMRVQSFQRGYERSEIEKLVSEASRAKYLVLDLRSNGGGAVNNLNHLLSLLLPPNTEVGTFVSRGSSERYAREHDGKVESDPAILAQATPSKFKTRKLAVPAFQGKIAVLINRGSASASEICAAALRDFAKAKVVGTRSAGAVLASVFRRLPNGYEIQYPISDYVTMAGMRLEQNPIVPDEEVTARPSEGSDPAVDKALEMLRAGETKSGR